MKIIVVDDDPTLRDALKGIIATRGHTVIAVYPSFRALQSAFDIGRPPEGFDLAVVDGLYGKWQDVITLLKHYRPEGIVVGFSSDEEEFGDVFVKKAGPLDTLLDVIDKALKERYPSS